MAVKRESIEAHAKAAHGAIVKSLKDLGVTITPLDGPSDEASLYSLQALQGLAADLKAHAEKSAQAENLHAASTSDSFGVSVADSKKAK